jgi:EAL domain-containing protein (putative c-di-GMP-specific phosphodiesterase class I)
MNPVYLKPADEIPSEPSLDYLLRQTVASLTEVSFLLQDLQKAVTKEPFHDHDPGRRDLIRMAESVLLAGRGLKSLRPGILNAAIGRDSREQRLIERALGEAVSTDALSLVFEPIVSSSTGECCAFEALLRWHHPERGAIPPAEFIPLAERTGDIVSIGRWVLLRACREAVTWPGSPPPTLSVNISPIQVVARSFVRDIWSVLSDSGLPRERLQIELTENLFAADHNAIAAALRELRRSGVRVALDDFGTGFSGFSHLRGFQVDAIKIDRSFTERFNTEDIPIVRAIVRLAQTLGLEVIAEGVETPDQAETLVCMGVQYLQGFLFTGHSLTPQGARNWARSKSPRIGSVESAMRAMTNR